MPAPIIPAVESGPATLDDLIRVEGKAEQVAGRIVATLGSGPIPTRVAFKIAMRLEAYPERTKSGVAYCDGIGFACIPPLGNGRQSFSPDASYYTGPLPANQMRYIEGAPVFAVEVRSENDYGAAAEAEMEVKSPTPSRPCRVGAWPSPTSSPDIPTNQDRPVPLLETIA